MFTIALLASLVLSAYGAVPHNRNLFAHSGRIVGGTPADILDYPYQVSLEWAKIHNCGGSIISKDWVLTAAHCVAERFKENCKIRAGTNIRGEGGSLHPVEKIISNPSFIWETADYDVGVIKVSVPFEFSDKVQPIALASAEPAPGTEVVATGWGQLSGGNITLPKELQQVRVNIVSFEECKANAEFDMNITERMICAGVTQGGHGVCNGDSGGPAVANGQVVGIVSWAMNCATDSTPQVYSNVANLKTWITDNTGVN